MTRNERELLLLNTVMLISVLREQYGRNLITANDNPSLKEVMASTNKGLLREMAKMLAYKIRVEHPNEDVDHETVESMITLLEGEILNTIKENLGKMAREFIDDDDAKVLKKMVPTDLGGLIQRSSDQMKIRESVQKFAELMELRLRENDHKGGWDGDEPSTLFLSLCKEVDELAIEIQDVDSYSPRDERRMKAVDRVLLEAADVANFAMMIAETASSWAYVVVGGKIFKIRFYPGEDGMITVECPRIDGCISQGKTFADAAVNISEAIEVILEDGEVK